MTKQNFLAAIDIGSSKVATLIVTSAPDESGRLNAVGVSSVPSRGIRKSQVVDIEEAIAAITDSVEAAERMAGFSVGNAIISVSGDHIKSINSKGVVAIGNPEGEVVMEDVSRVIEAAKAISIPSSQEIIHVLPRTFSVDSQEGVRDPLGMSGVRLEAEAHIVTGATAVIRNLRRCIEDIAVKTDHLVFAGLASAQATLTDTEKELGVVLVDIGGGTTSIAVFIDGALSYSAVIPVGAKNITNDLAIGLRISLESAEKIKRHLTQMERMPAPSLPGEEDGKKMDRHSVDEIDFSNLNIKEEIRSASRKTLIDGIIRPRLNEIFDFVGNEIKKSGFGGMTPAGVVITGGGAETVEVLSACKRTLQMPARIGYPGGLHGLTDEISSPAYATLTGLILHVRSLPAKSGRSMGGLFSGQVPGKDLAGKALSFLKSLLP
jgi:cell division protein FtsA